MTTLGLTFADLYKEVSNYLGLGLTPTGGDLTLAKKYANDGYRLFLMGVDPRSARAYQWSFLAPAASLSLSPGADTFALPDDFAAILDDPAYASDSDARAVGASAGGLSPRSAAYIRQLDAGGATSPASGEGASPGAPRYYAILPRAFTPAQGQRYDLLVWPAPAASCTLRYRYRREPAALAGDADYPLGGPQHAMTLLQAGLAVAEQRHNDARGIHTDQFERLMAFSIDLDSANKPHNLGDSGGGPTAGGTAAAAGRGMNPVTYP
jgi:hypothetical protein